MAGRILAVLVGLLAVTAVAVLSANVSREIRELQSASSDNVQWSLSQTEVEFQELKGHLQLGEDLSGIRRRFDIYYSRIRTVSEAKVFAQVRSDPGFARHLAAIEEFLDRAVPLVDGADELLLASIPSLIAMGEDIRSDVRGLSNAGLKQFAERADQQRVVVARTLMQLALALAFLISLLGLGVIYLIRLNRTISERERHQLRTATRINTIMNTSLDGVIVSDDAGHITGFNAAAEKMFGHNAQDVMGCALGQIIVPPNLRAAHEAGMLRMRQGGEQRVVGKGRVQLAALRADGTVFPVELAVQSATTDEGQIYIAFLRDVSQRVADEAELINTRDRAIAGEQSRSEFLATMSHEIRTPLNGLLGNMSLLRETPLTARQDTYLRHMETSGRLLMSHVSDVLDIARYDSGKISARAEPMNISDLLQDIIDNQSGMAGANFTSLEWRWEGMPQHWINGDSDRLQHVLMNLIGNAVKFTKCGRVTVTLAWDRDGFILFDVADTGIGIPDSLKDRIFDDFVTGHTAYDRDVGGTGLGLSIVKRFVAALGGSVAVTSEEGVGTTFSVRLPATRAVPVQPPEPETQREAAQTITPLRVLVVEDNEINRFVVRTMLTSDGHDVTEAHDGRQGVDAANAEAFDLILMDISMPVLDGRSATREIRKGQGLSAKAQIIALTANVLEEERADFLAQGMDDVVTKPLTKAALQAVLARIGQPDQEAGSQALVDLSHLAETRSITGLDAFPALLDRFIRELDDFAGWVETGRPMSDLAARAHKIAGNAALFGATGLLAQLRALEGAASQSREQDVATAIAALSALIAATKQALRAQTAPAD